MLTDWNIQIIDNFIFIVVVTIIAIHLVEIILKKKNYKLYIKKHSWLLCVVLTSLFPFAVVKSLLRFDRSEYIFFSSLLCSFTSSFSKSTSLVAYCCVDLAIEAIFFRISTPYLPICLDSLSDEKIILTPTLLHSSVKVWKS